MRIVYVFNLWGNDARFFMRKFLSKQILSISNHGQNMVVISFKEINEMKVKCTYFPSFELT